MKDIKVALIHDWLTGRRGGEKVLEIFAEIFPQAPIYTLFHFPGSQVEIIEKSEIFTSFLQKMPLLKKKYRSYLPFFPLAVELFDLQEFDLVISSSHCVAKGVIPRPDALHICYVHSPVRYAWNQYFSYFSPQRLGLLSRFIIPPIIHKLRLWDESSSHRVDHFVANSKTVGWRIQKYYRREAVVIHPPVDTDFFKPSELEDDYYLIVSALSPYKRIDIAIEAFNRTGFPLKIVGVGPDNKKLRKMAQSNIQFLGVLDDQDLIQAYQGAKALVMPGEEDFGINSLESQACGVPVISYCRGGATETVIPEMTGLFFSKLSAESLCETLDKFEGITFNKNKIRDNALNFSRDKFKEKMIVLFQEKWTEHKKQLC